MRSRFLVFVTLFFVLCARAQTVKVSGETGQQLILTAADLAAMPHMQATARDKRHVSQTYSGVALAEIFKRAGVTTGPELRGRNMAKYVLVSCADGYKVVFSLAELDSSFTNRVVILADRMKGKPLPAKEGPFKIVVPGEKKPARNCFGVTEIVIRMAKD